MEIGDQFPYHATFDWKNKIFLGQGSYGVVYKVKNTQDGQFYAIKQMKMEQFNKDPMLMSSLKGEIAITMDVNSEHTVKMLDAKIGHKFTYMILQLCDTDLRKELAQRKFTEADCVKAFEEIMQGFSVLVHKGYIHRDVKPANTLVKNHHYKVADFGFACKADIFGKKKLTDICGTPIYMAPQLLKNEPYTSKSDIWSLGLMFYEMIFGYAPWPCRSLEEYLDGICRKPLSFPYNAQIGENTKDFLKKTLIINEDKRMSWEQVFSHPLIFKKQVGQNVAQIKISSYVRDLFIRLQGISAKKKFQWDFLAQTYRKQKIDLQTMGKILKEIDPVITTHQISVLFDFMNRQHQPYIDWATFERDMVMVDYRSQDDVFSRKVDQIIAIMREIKADPMVIFDQIDINHSGSLDFSEFSKFIATIAPCYTKPEVLQIYKLFDNDKNGLISKQQFLGLLGSRLPSKKLHSQHAIQQQRAARNIKQLIGYMKWSGINAQSVLNIADKDNSHTLQFHEFSQLITNNLKFKISPEEIEQLFAVINKDKNDKITIGELRAVLV